jgi:beta-N-acetylhexosaminidase
MNPVVDLTASPYDLDTEQVQWVEDTLERLTPEQKVGQLFVNLFFFGGDTFSGNNLSNDEIVKEFGIGGARYQDGDSTQVQDLLNALQRVSAIPLLVAANCDAGGNGASGDGTYIASGAQADASGDEQVAYDAGYVSAREAKALGVNLNFDPCVDILFNWRNTIVNTRAYGDNTNAVIRWTNAYIDGYRAGGDGEMATCIKHFPGDGTEERPAPCARGQRTDSGRMGRFLRPRLPQPHRARRRDDHGRTHRPAALPAAVEPGPAR